MLQTAGLFCCTGGLFLIECDLISNPEFPSSPIGTAVTRSFAAIRKTERPTGTNSSLLTGCDSRQTRRGQPFESFLGAGSSYLRVLCNGYSSCSVLEEGICFPASTINPTDNISQGRGRKHHLVKSFFQFFCGLLKDLRQGVLRGVFERSSG